MEDITNREQGSGWMVEILDSDEKKKLTQNKSYTPYNQKRILPRMSFPSWSLHIRELREG